MSHLPGPLVVSFSGIDGAGKSTHIAALQEAIAQMGWQCRVITFWDDVVVAGRWRESFVHRVFGSERGVGAPGMPVARRDKNVRSSYLTAIRCLLYLADAIHLRMVLRRLRREKSEVILVDRYIYDELANLPLGGRVFASFARLAAGIAPRPELALLIDAEPEVARARKPEYPLEFLGESRDSYLRLALLLGGMRLIPPLPLDDAQQAIWQAFVKIAGGKVKQAA
jgi:thymidylate kinase